ncbi:MAG: c-type cytochrome [Magnetococcales bacterium]|nr:c-type cytochrome [Magnetococcales bacterium]
MTVWAIAGPLLAVVALVGVGAAEAGNPFAGQGVFARHCQGCHGPQGRGVLASTPDFSWRGMQTNGLMAADPELAQRIMRGKNACPSYQGILSEAEVMDVITHLRTLR